MSRETIFEASLEYFLDPIGPFLRDETVTEIMVNGHREIYIERRGKLERTEAAFESEDALLSAVHNVAQYVGRIIDRDRPVLDARLPNGSRVHAVIPPSARGGIYLTIRKFLRDVLTLDDFIRVGSLSPAAREFLTICIRLRKNIVIAGGTGTGKTTLLNAVSSAIPDDERIVVIEDSSELRLDQPHTLYLEAQKEDAAGRGALNIRQLFVACLRMRPDRIVVGEVRGGEALDMVQSMISGHSGSLTTVHATTPGDALIRLETLSLMSDVDLPVYVARAQVASAIDLVVQITRFASDGSRRVTRITEVGPLSSEQTFQTHDLFDLHTVTQQGNPLMMLEPTGRPAGFAEEIDRHGLRDSVRSSTPVWATKK